MTYLTRRRTDMLILGALLPLAACGSEKPVELPFGTAQQMMADEVQPAADIYWQAVRFESRLEEDGSVVEEDFRPETDAEWAEVAQSAVRLTELADTLMTPAYAEGRGADWNVFAQGLSDAARIAEQAALDKDPDAVFEVGGTVYNVCRACHQSYPPENMPEGEQGVDTPSTEGVDFEAGTTDAAPS